MSIRPPEEARRLPPTAFVYSVPLKGSTGPAEQLSPEEVHRRALFENARKTGEWISWFTEVSAQQEEVFTLHGYPRQVREAAIEPLKRVYTPRACLKMMRDPQNAEIVSGLFSPWLPWSFPLLELAADLRSSEPWSDKKLLGDLCSHEAWATAKSELEAWRCLRRIDPFPEREPLGPDGRRPDFAVSIFGRRHVVEVKTLRTSEGEHHGEWLRQQMSLATGNLYRPGRRMEVSASPLVRQLMASSDGRSALQAAAQTKLTELADAAGRLAAEGYHPGQFRVGDWFSIEIIDDPADPNGTVATAVWEGAPEAHRAVRIATLVEGAMLQIPQSSNSIVLIVVAHAIDPDAVAAELRRRMANQPIRFSSLRLVLVRWRRRVTPFRFEPTGIAIPTRGPLVPSEKRIAGALLR